MLTSRGCQQNLSFFAFTATPKGKTLEVFGRPGRPEEPKAPLSEIIALLNDRHGSELGEADRLFFEEVRAEACADAEVVSLAQANDPKKFELGVRQRVAELMVERIGKNDEIVTRYMDDDFQATAFPLLARAIWEAANEAGFRHPA